MAFNLNSIPAGQERAYIDKMIAAGMVKVTRCPPAARQYDSRIQRAAGGGPLPAHLHDSVYHAEPGALAEEYPDRIAAPAHGKISRKIRRAA